EVRTAARARGAEALAIAADCKVTRDRERIVAQTLERTSRIDCLVNAAGIIASGNIESTSLADFEAMFNLNVTACMHLIQLCVPALAEHRGSVVNVSSVAGLRS